MTAFRADSQRPEVLSVQRKQQPGGTCGRHLGALEAPRAGCRWRAGDRTSKRRVAAQERYRQQEAAASDENSPSLGAAANRSASVSKALINLSQRLSPLPSAPPTVTAPAQQQPRQPPLSPTTNVCLISPIILLQLILLILSPFTASVYARQPDSAPALNQQDHLGASHLQVAPSMLAASVAGSDEAATKLAHSSSYADRRDDSGLSRASTAATALGAGGYRALTSGECHRLSQFASWLRATYPALANHLFAVAAPLGGQHLAARFAQASASIRQILDEANQIASREHLADPAAKSKAWMRVLANPAYAKLVRQLKAQQWERQHLERHLAHREEIPADSQPQHFGRVLHYPHEMVGNQRTLDKLHELSRQNQRLPEGVHEVELESNKIPPPESAGGDGPPWHKAENSDESESARARFVYGNVLLRPEQNNDSEGQRRLSWEALRRLNSDAPGGQVQNETPKEPSESYGRVLLSPPNFSIIQRHIDDKNQQQQQPEPEHNIEERPHKQTDRSERKSTLNKLRQQLDSSQFEGGEPTSTGNVGSGAPNELAAQQTSGSANVVSASNGFSDPSDAEFEGHWHSGPIEQVELRPIRDEGRPKQPVSPMPDSLFIIN